MLLHAKRPSPNWSTSVCTFSPQYADRKCKCKKGGISTKLTFHKANSAIHLVHEAKEVCMTNAHRVEKLNHLGFSGFQYLTRIIWFRSFRHEDAC